ncbi:MAG: hypothetical protein IT196_06910 [Acidimicrobiales bacterium]|nr:hypothetical protein [Acidimicrobiales bacterium]
MVLGFCGERDLTGSPHTVPDDVGVVPSPEVGNNVSLESFTELSAASRDFIKGSLVTTATSSSPPAATEISPWMATPLPHGRPARCDGSSQAIEDHGGSRAVAAIPGL